MQSSPGPLIDVTEHEPSNVIGFSRDGKLLARGDCEGGIIVYDTIAPRKSTKLPSHNGADISGLAFGPRGSLFSGSTKIGRGYGGNVAKDDLDGAAHISVALEERNGAGWLGYSQAANMLICIPLPGVRMHFYDPDTLQRESTIKVWSRKQSGALVDAAIGETGRIVALLSEKNLTIWDVIERRQIAHVAGKRAVAVNDARAMIATVPVDAQVGPPSEVLLISAADGTVAARLSGPIRQVGPLAFSPDGRYVIAGGLDSGEIDIWDTRTRQLVKSFNPFIGQEYVAALAVSPDGKFVAACPRQPRVLVWRLADLVGGTGPGEDHHKGDERKRG